MYPNVINLLRSDHSHLTSSTVNQLCLPEGSGLLMVTMAAERGDGSMCLLLLIPLAQHFYIYFYFLASFEQLLKSH